MPRSHQEHFHYRARFSRRRLLKAGAAALAMPSLSQLALAADQKGQYPPLRTVTHGPKHHWFACYDKLQFDPSGRIVVLGRFYNAPQYTGEWRVDLHPRISPDGRLIVVDSPHSGQGRQMHIIDISHIVG